MKISLICPCCGGEIEYIGEKMPIKKEENDIIYGSKYEMYRCKKCKNEFYWRYGWLYPENRYKE